jgi:3-hydroxybutyrate dehydrogenase
MFLKGKTALVTGSTSGIGLAYAKALAGQGAAVVINGFGEADAIEAARASLAEMSGVPARYKPTDMSDPAAIAAMVAEVNAEIGGPDIVIDNAGMQHVEAIDTFPTATWDKIIAINLSSAFHLMQAAIPLMKEKKWGGIISTASATR